jgi:hypothetical protein
MRRSVTCVKSTSPILTSKRKKKKRAQPSPSPAPSETVLPDIFATPTSKVSSTPSFDDFDLVSTCTDDYKEFDSVNDDNWEDRLQLVHLERHLREVKQKTKVLKRIMTIVNDL